MAGGLFLVLAIFGLVTSRSTSGIAALWPANGVILTALIVAPVYDRWRYVAMCSAASVAANWVFGTSPLIAFAFTVANLAGVGVSYGTLRRGGYGHDFIDSAAGIVWFAVSLCCGVPAGGAVAAVTIWLTGGQFAEAWLSWTASDLLGMALATLLALSIVRPEDWRGAKPAVTSFAIASWPLAVVAAAAFLVFSQSRFPALFVPLAVVMIATYRLGLFGAVAGTCIVALVGSGFIAVGRGPIALIAGGTMMRIQFFQFYLVSVLGTSLPLAALLAERGRLMRDKIESERLYRLLADNSNDMIVRLTLQGVRRYVSPASRTVLGYEPAELVGNPAAGSIHPDDRPVVIATCQTLLAGVENPICAYRQLRKDGTYVWLEASYRLIRDPVSGMPEEFIASVRDISRRQQAEGQRTELAARTVETNRLLSMAEEMGGVGHWRLDLASGVVTWSDTVALIHGRPRGHRPILGTALDAYHPDDRAMVGGVVQAAIQNGLPYRFAAKLIRPDGMIRHVVSHGRAETGPDGTVTGLFGVFQDVTDAYTAQQALEHASHRLAESNRLLKLAEAVAHVGHWRLDRSSGTLQWSDEIYNIYGIGRDVVPTVDSALSIYHPDDRARVRATIDAAFAAGEGYTSKARIVRSDGRLVHIMVRSETDFADDGSVRGFFGIVQDITEQAEAEAALREREARFRLITEEASDMISVHDIDGRCLFMSPASRTVLGYDPDELLGSVPHDFIANDDHPAFDAHRERVLGEQRGGVSTVRVRLCRADDTLRWIEIASRMTRLDGRACVISVCRDADMQVAAEAALRDARALAEAAAHAKSTFLANMSHEVRTPMNGVVGFTELLLASDLDPEQRRQTELIADSGRAMMRLLNDILDLSKVEAGQMGIASEAFDVRHALKACANLVRPAIEGKGVALHCRIDDLPRMILGDGLRLRQIMLNLLGNATKFTHHGSITLSTSVRGDILRIDVVDTGIGIPEDRRAAIFEQFVQADTGTAAKYGGTGLGLAISSQLARLMGGDLSLESQVGVGTRFILLLPLRVPLVPGLGPARTSTPASPAPNDTGGRILVAEDNEVNQLLITAMLRKLGYEHDVVSDGAQAVAKVESAAKAGNSYRLVLMDMQMPVMDGITATREIRTRGFGAKALPIVALTANAYADDVAACREAGMQDHLAKPYGIDVLGAMLRRWCADPGVSPSGTSRFGAKVQARYAERRSETLEALAALIRRGSYAEAELADVAAMLHKLAGTAGMFGEAALGEEARRLEKGVETWPDADRVALINASVAAILDAA
ncbi:PAS domain S-box protein [uncultured Sphingomonas sp.]|uniref:PAS domain S-box protein n=1 Tax=uncultured Sphingomonas sp. TaxID=158754 RepID=UPI0035CA701C